MVAGSSVSIDMDVIKSLSLQIHFSCSIRVGAELPSAAQAR